MRASRPLFFPILAAIHSPIQRCIRAEKNYREGGSAKKRLFWFGTAPKYMIALSGRVAAKYNLDLAFDEQIFRQFLVGFRISHRIAIDRNKLATIYSASFAFAGKAVFAVHPSPRLHWSPISSSCPGIPPLSVLYVRPIPELVEWR